MSKFFEALIPTSASPLAQARAKVLAATCLALAGAIIALLLYWVVFSWLEQIETVVIGLVLVLILAGIILLVRSGRVTAAAWTLTIFMLLLNLANMVDYGISSTASGGYIIVIALAVFTLGPAIGLGSAVLGSVTVFAIALAASTGQLETQLPYQESTLSFDAVVLTLIYLLVGLLCAVWSKAANQAL